jgi:hypothetical protein
MRTTLTTCLCLGTTMQWEVQGRVWLSWSKITKDRLMNFFFLNWFSCRSNKVTWIQPLLVLKTSFLVAFNSNNPTPEDIWLGLLVTQYDTSSLEQYSPCHRRHLSFGLLSAFSTEIYFTLWRFGICVESRRHQYLGFWFDLLFSCFKVTEVEILDGDTAIMMAWATKFASGKG